MEDPRCPKRNLNFRIKTEPACHGLTAGSDATVYVQLLYTYISNCDRLGFNVEIQIYIGTVQVHISFAKEKVCHLDNRYQKNGQVSRNKYFPLLISQNQTLLGPKVIFLIFITKRKNSDISSQWPYLAFILLLLLGWGIFHTVFLIRLHIITVIL